MKRTKRIFIGVWLFMIFQTVFIQLFGEPYPAFAFPGFGHRGLKEQNYQSIQYKYKFGVVTTSDSLITLPDSPCFYRLEDSKKNVLAKRTLFRYKKNFDPSKLPLHSKIHYSKDLLPSQLEIDELQTWIKVNTDLDAKAFVVMLIPDDFQPIVKGTTPKKIDTVAVFK